MKLKMQTEDSDMKKEKVVSWQRGILSFIVGFSLVSSSALAIQKKPEENRVASEPPSASSTVEATCGPELEFDRNSGRMVRKNRVDLIVTQVEMKRTTSGGVAIKPTIKNRCSGRITKNVSVSVDDVVLSFGTPPPNTPVTTTAVVLGNKTSYRVKVDYGNQVNEINERNNSCTATFPASMDMKIHRCR